MLQLVVKNLSRRPALKTFILLVLGLVIGYYFEFPLKFIFITLCIFFIAMLALSAFKVRNLLILHVLFYGAIVIAGIFHYELFSHSLDAKHILKYRPFLQKRVKIEGIIYKAPLCYDDQTVITLDLKFIFLKDKQQKISGRIIVYLRRISGEILYGDKVQLAGNLQFPRGEKNPGGFNYRKYLRARGIHAIMYVRDDENCIVISHGHGKRFFRYVIYPIKAYISEYLETAPDEITSSFLKGFILGDRKQLAPEIVDALSKTGVSHILAVSGLHVGFVLMIFWVVFGLFRLPQPITRCLIIIALILYACVTDLKPPVVRATIMAGIFLLSPLFRKKSDAFNSLAISGLIILALNPAELFEIGFQLSFMAVFSILYFYPIFVTRIGSINSFQRFYKKSVLKAITNLLLLSLSVQLGTLPLALLYFGIIPTLAILLNLIIIPAVGIILSLAAAALAFNLLFSSLAEFYLLVDSILVRHLIHFIQTLADLPGAYVLLPQPNTSFIIICYLTLFCGVQLDFRKIKKYSLIFILLIINLVIWKSILNDPDVLRVIFFDVGQGDAALVKFPDGKCMLIDGGIRDDRFDAGERIIAPYLRREGIKKIDFVSVSHQHADHLGGIIYILKNFKTGKVLDNGCSHDSKLFQQYLHLVDSLHIPRQITRAGDQLTGIPGIDILFYHPSDQFLKWEKDDAAFENNSSVVVQIIYGKTSFLLTGDIEREPESYLLRFQELLECDVLKVPHHGSITSSSFDFLNYVQPRFAVISVGEFNRFSHPSDIIIRRLQQLKIKPIQTMKNGAVIFESDGNVVKRIR